VSPRPRLSGLLACALSFGLASCLDRQPGPPRIWTVSVSGQAPEAVQIAARDLVRYLGAMGLEARLTLRQGPPPSCTAYLGEVALLGDGLGEPRLGPGATDQTWKITETRCEGGRLVLLSGGGILGRQYAVYDWLHRLGVRFFHPEQEYVPKTPRWPEAPLAIEHTPPFRFRSVSLHLTHPLELGDPLRLGKTEHLEEVRRYIDWQVKNLASDGISGASGGGLERYGEQRGFPRSAGISLHNTQQGGERVVDPDDPRPVEEQIAAAIEARMAPGPDGKRPDLFGFTFNPSEFTEIDDRQAVREMTFIADYMAANYPQTILHTINHGTAGAPTAHYGLRFYDLPRLAPANLGVKVHTLMFYDLFRPAPVYGNESFRFLYDFMVSEYRTRRLWYFPEAAWWLTFDLAVPLYLPITIEARDRDIQGIAFMLKGHLVGHHVFGTGHEWGYWQNEYCSLRLSADLAYRHRDCLADLTSPMGEAAPGVQAVLERVIALQERDFIYGDILAYLVGTDPETEAAAAVGVVFHPLPPSPFAILGWDQERVEAWDRRIRPALVRMDEDYAELVDRLAQLASQVPEDGWPWFAEIRDGIEVTGLRARHAWQIYGAAVTARQARLRFDAALHEEALSLLAAARETTARALSVIARREAGYRYRPLARAIAGGPTGDEDQNWTIYRYRYLNRTHHGYYYTRIDDLVARALLETGEPATVANTLLGPGEPLLVETSDAGVSEVTAEYGDGVRETGQRLSHTYGAAGIYDLRLFGTRRGEPFELTGKVAQATAIWRTGFSARIEAPSGAAMIEPVLPAIVLGRVDEQRLALGFEAEGNGQVKLGGWTALPTTAGTAFVEGSAARLFIPIVNRSTSAILASIVVRDARLVLAQPPGLLTLSGDLSTQAVIDALVAVGGFEPSGARAIVASTLGHTPDTLPAWVPLVVRYTVLP
jgi:hypothetical protein